MMSTQHCHSKFTSSHSFQVIILHPKVSLEPHLYNILLTHCVTGRKKLKQVEAEINRLSHVSHPNILRIFAVKLSLPHDGAGSARLVILSEKRPQLSLDDLLEDGENLRENRASVS